MQEVSSDLRPLRNAATVLLAAQKQPKLPDKVSPESAAKNAKFRLRNSIIDWLDRSKLGWSQERADSHGRSFVLLLTDVLWHLDGHHSTLKTRACAVPQMFSKFVGFNCPERYKGKKRGPESLCYKFIHKRCLK